jgi:hypothetical protein
MYFFATACSIASRAPDRDVVNSVRAIRVSAIDAAIADERDFASWLEDRALNRVIAWEENDCGEQTGDPKTTPSKVPVCVEAAFSNCEGRKTVVAFAIGDRKNLPQFFWASTAAGTSEQTFHSLPEMASANPRCSNAPPN